MREKGGGMSGLMTLAFLGGGTPGFAELAVVLVVMLLVFGNRVPEIMRSLGKGLSQFKKGLHEAQNEIEREIDTDPGPDHPVSDHPVSDDSGSDDSGSDDPGSDDSEKKPEA